MLYCNINYESRRKAAFFIPLEQSKTYNAQMRVYGRTRIDNEENLQNSEKAHYANRYFDKKINYYTIE